METNDFEASRRQALNGWVPFPMRPAEALAFFATALVVGSVTLPLAQWCASLLPASPLRALPYLGAIALVAAAVHVAVRSVTALADRRRNEAKPE